MKQIVFVFTLLLVLHSYSQESKTNKHIPYFQSLNPSKLALHLTKKLESDSEKVIAIHSWITHTIKFDVNRWLSFDYSPTPLRRILTKRKAISTDYSILFDELCKYSNIQSTIIRGYTKNEYVDASDKFYLDEQTWNAVKINDEWFLVDACMNAGKIEYYKRTFAGYFIYAFSLGMSDRLVYRPHFKSSPSSKYLLKTGYFFQTDHFPSNPIWQLKNKHNSITNFENDSSSYYQKFDTITKNQSNDDFSQKRTTTAALNGDEIEINDGFNSFSTNNKNNYGIGNSYFLKALKLYDEVAIESTEKETMIAKCDSISNWLALTLTHCDTNTYFLKKQKLELIEKNKTKKEIVTRENKSLITSTEKSLKTISLGLKIGLTGGINLKTTQQKNKFMNFKIARNKKFKNTKSGRKTIESDSILYSNLIRLYKDSIILSKNKLQEKFSKIDNLHALFIKNTNEFSIKSVENDKIGRNLCNLRLRFKDDLDYPIRKIKDSLLIKKTKDDSLLIDGKNSAIVNEFYINFNSLKENFNSFYKYTSSLDSEYSKFKKSINSKYSIDQQQAIFIDSFKNDVKKYNQILKTYKQKFKKIHSVSKKQLEPSKAENYTYLKEQYIEFQMNVIRASFINRHFKVRINENKSLKNKCIKLNKKCLKDRKKLLSPSK